MNSQIGKSPSHSKPSFDHITLPYCGVENFIASSGTKLVQIGRPTRRSGHERMKTARLPSRNDRNLVLGEPPDGGDPRQVARALLDAADVVQRRQPGEKLWFHIDAGSPGIVLDADRYVDRSGNALVVRENLVGCQKPVRNGQDHYGVATDLLGMFRQRDARRCGARPGAGDDRDATGGMLCGDVRGVAHFLIAKRAVPAGAAQHADAVHAVRSDNR